MAALRPIIRCDSSPTNGRTCKRSLMAMNFHNTFFRLECTRSSEVCHFALFGLYKKNLKKPERDSLARKTRCLLRIFKPVRRGPQKRKKKLKSGIFN